MVNVDDESSFQPGLLIIFLKLKNKQTLLSFKPIHYDPENNLEKEAFFFILPPDDETFSFDSTSEQINENGIININSSVWSNILENTQNASSELGKLGGFHKLR